MTDQKWIHWSGLALLVASALRIASWAFYPSGPDTALQGSWVAVHIGLLVSGLLLLFGLYMLGLFSLGSGGSGRLARSLEKRSSFRAWDSFLLGLILALAFCPYSGVLYFGMMVPLMISTSAPLLPMVFAMSAAIPVVIFAWLLAFSVSGIGSLFRRIKSFEFWFRKVVALLFMGIGIYSIIQLF